MVEEYDPSDEGGEVQEYAWVADQIVRVNGDADVKRAKEQGLRGEAWDAMADLRDEVAKGEALGWWVILNGDPERGDKGAGAGGRGGGSGVTEPGNMEVRCRSPAPLATRSIADC